MADPKGHGGVEVNVLNSDEPWNEYRLLNTDIKVRLKLMINRIYSLKDRYEANGDPLYIVNFATVPTIEH
jgi:hypothetical protein